MSGQGARLTSKELAEWESGDAAHRLAAHLAADIQTDKLEAYASLPTNAELGRWHDVSPATASRAKRLLIDRNMIRREGRYHVVIGPPARSVTGLGPGQAGGG
jgi:DNA-binding GntR family transcriptional regulator